MQSTSVDVVSEKPEAGAEPVGQAEYVAAFAGLTGERAGAAEAVDEASTGTRAAITAIAERTPTRRFIVENIFCLRLFDLYVLSPRLHKREDSTLVKKSIKHLQNKRVVIRKSSCKEHVKSQKP